MLALQAGSLGSSRVWRSTSRIAAACPRELRRPRGRNAALYLESRGLHPDRPASSSSLVSGAGLAACLWRPLRIACATCSRPNGCRTGAAHPSAARQPPPWPDTADGRRLRPPPVTSARSTSPAGTRSCARSTDDLVLVVNLNGELHATQASAATILRAGQRIPGRRLDHVRPASLALLSGGREPLDPPPSCRCGLRRGRRGAEC